MEGTAAQGRSRGQGVYNRPSTGAQHGKPSTTILQTSPVSSVCVFLFRRGREAGREAGIAAQEGSGGRSLYKRPSDWPQHSKAGPREWHQSPTKVCNHAQHLMHYCTTWDLVGRSIGIVSCGTQANADTPMPGMSLSVPWDCRHVLGHATTLTVHVPAPHTAARTSKQEMAGAIHRVQLLWYHFSLFYPDQCCALCQSTALCLVLNASCVLWRHLYCIRVETESSMAKRA